MNHRPECLPCCLRRVLHAADRATTDDWLRRKIVLEAMQKLSKLDDKATPAEVIHVAARRASKTLGVADPYAEERSRWIGEALAREEAIRATVDDSEDPFTTALRLSMAANILDCELRQDFERNVSIQSILDDHASVPFVADNLEDFRRAVEEAETVLFVHDSAGELFFDRLLIEAMRKPPSAIFSVVRESPILADATGEDAAAVGLEKVATILTPGVDALGLPVNACSETLQKCYRSASLVVAKGQAAFETLEGKDGEIDGEKKQVFFLLRVKCSLLARHLGAAVGDSVLEVA